MKTLSLIIFLTLPLFSFADFPTINITNFSVDYTAPNGVGNAEEFETPDEYVTIRDKAFEISFIKQNDQFIFYYNSNEFILEKPPTILTDAESFNWSNLNFHSLEKKIKFTLEGLNYKSPKDSGRMQGFSLDCTENEDSDDEFNIKILESCLKQSKIKMSRFTSTSKKVLENLISQSVFNIEPQETTTIKNFNATVSNHSFALKVTAKVDITATVKASGKVWYLKDENQIKVKLRKAKVGFISIKGKIFSELEKDTSGKILVRRPYIFIDLNE